MTGASRLPRSASGREATVPPPRWSLVWLFGFVLATVSGALTFLYFYLDDVAHQERGTFARRLLEEATGSYLALPLFVGVIWLTLHYPVERRGWARHAHIHLTAAVAYSLIHTSLLWGSRSALSIAFGWGAYDYGSIPVRYLMELPNDLLSYVSYLLMVTLYRYYQTVRDRELHAARLERGLAQAELHNLRLQLQPHFLFNALNTISSTMYEDPRAADRMIGQLSELLRLSLRTSHTHEVTLGEEVEVLERYMGLMRARFGDRLRVSIDVAPNASAALVPSLLLQPLVENAVRHGNAAKLGRGSVSVRGERDGDELLLEVADDGPGAPPDIDLLGRGVGLRSTAERLTLMYGSRHRLWMGNRAGGFVVSIRVPFRERAPTGSDPTAIDTSRLDASVIEVGGFESVGRRA